MADAEHPDDPGGGEDKGRGKKTRTRSRGKARSGSDAGAPDPSPEAKSAAGDAPAPAPAAPASDPAPAFEPPAPGSAPMDEGSERGISGALALWGPLIIIGFLVLVLNTQETPPTPDTGAAAGAAAATGSLEAAEALPASTEAESTEAPEASELAAVEPQPAIEEAAQASEESVPQASASGEAALESVPEAPAAPSSEPESVAMTEVPAESGDGASGSGAALEEPVAQAGEGAGVSDDLDLGAVLEAARSVISQEVGDALAEAVSDADAPALPAAPEASAATLSSMEAPPAPSLAAAPEASGIATSSWGASQPGGQGEVPIWSSGANPWALTSSSPDESGWGEGAGTTARSGGGSRVASTAGRVSRRHDASAFRGAHVPGRRVLAPASGPGSLRSALLLVHRPPRAHVPFRARSRVSVSAALRGRASS